MLGSCVGVTFLVPRLGIGALCHPMLPRCPANRAAALSVEAGRRYVDFAIRDLARQFDRCGARAQRGAKSSCLAAPMCSWSAIRTRETYGRKAELRGRAEVLQEEGFTVFASSLGGTLRLNIRFNTRTGEVLLRGGSDETG
jgi:chemotaxis protein CheD